jgi:hypothetical protein
MSYEVASEAGSLGQFASNCGYGDLIAASASNETLKEFFSLGYAADPATVKNVAAALKALAVDPNTADDVSSTALGLASLIAGEELVFLTNGTYDGEDDPEEPEDSEPEPLDAAATKARRAAALLE